MSEQWGKLSDDWMYIDEIIIYGFGNVAEVVFEKLQSDINIRFVIDNASTTHMAGKKRIPIYSYDECRDMINQTKIIVVAETIACGEIVELLEADGYCEDKDFTTLERFVTEWYYRRFKQANLLEIHTSITTKCTFNCRYCNVFMPYCKEKIDYTIDEMKKILICYFYISIMFLSINLSVENHF